MQDQEAEDLSLKLEDLKKNEKGRARRIKTLETEIAKMESELENPPSIESMEAVNDDQVSISFLIPGLF
jgi:structural maintenance of chromosomes protein 5